MKNALIRLPMVVLLSLTMLACATIPKAPDPQRLKAANVFVHSLDLGAVAMIALKRELETQKTNTSEAMTAIVQEALADVKAEDFERLIANIYASRLSLNTLQELSEYVSKPAGQKIFKIGIANALEGKPEGAEKELIKQLNIVELTELMKFSQSKAFAELQRELPSINQELAEAGRRLGERKLKEYLKKH